MVRNSLGERLLIVNIRNLSSGNLKPRLYCKKQQVKAQELCPDRAS